MPRGVRVLEGPLLSGPRIVDTRIVLSGTRIALGPRSTTIRSWTVAAHTVIVLDRLVVIRHWATIVDRSIAEAITGLAACTVVGKARILSGGRLTLVSDPRVVGNRRLLGLWLLALWLWLLLLWCLTLISEARIVGDRRLLSRWCLTLISDPWVVTRVLLIGNGATVIDGTLISSTRIVAGMTIVRNRTAIGNRATIVVAIIRNRSTVIMTFIGNRTVVMVTVVSVTVMTGHCTGTRTSGCTGTGGTGASGCTGTGVLVAVLVDVGIELIGVLKLAFLFETLLLGKTIAFSGVSVELLSFSLLALSLCGLNLSVGIGLLGLGLAVFGVRFPSMYFMLGLSSLLTDPGGLLALVFALLSCGLTADRDDDADDNQNNDDRNDYPDNGSCTHALSPCCLFGSH
ncbi:hypothetical protein [Brevibacterium sp. UCMA 11754]|uniref:hypothetical protein n=1 Tax=Brevibacterium sp. UCMA 11754 TaxID=2749198 RepID=UPI001F170450|nr:hypothetical protein [Brevibacterium sp. UCMA 11754]MCF2571234.1 hypothetical protein [Brevibacterium sp. UCMA 11754]